ncbi:MAG: AIM24 family protein, partial [Cardiobacterium sp.]
MPVFTPTGELDPFLHVSLRRGESIYCESDAMVMMEANLELR